MSGLWYNSTYGNIASQGRDRLFHVMSPILYLIWSRLANGASLCLLDLFDASCELTPRSTRTIGVVGAAFSEISQAINQVASIFGHPQVRVRSSSVSRLIIPQYARVVVMSCIRL